MNTSSNRLVAIVMGSASDWPTLKEAGNTLRAFGVPFEAHVLSAVLCKNLAPAPIFEV